MKPNRPGTPPLPPWADAPHWAAVNHTIGYWLAKRPAAMRRVSRLAGRLQSRMDDLDPQMRALSRSLCHDCAAPCCAHAKPWFDLADLLRLHLCRLPLPPGQPIGSVHERCRYFGPKGCGLPRRIRPWICTWYLCPAMKRALNRNGAESVQRAVAALDTVKNLRRRMETAFIDTLAADVQAGGQ